MREMKDSGIEWIGKIPHCWNTSKLKYLGQYINGYAFKPEEWGSKGVPIIRIQDLTGSNDNPNYFEGQIDKKYGVENGDILISWAATLDAFIWNKGNGWLNQHIFKAVPNRRIIDYDFFFWMIKESMKNMNNDNKHGIFMQHVTLSVFNNFTIPMPPLAEQHRIAAFLDRKCAEIDAVLEKTRASIEEYKKLKQAVITQAVTKGVRGDRPMKDSGIEWIGEIPVEWEIRKIFRAIDKVGDIDHYMPDSVDDGIPYLMTGDLQEKLSDVNLKRCKKVSFQDYEMLSSKIRVSKGDVIFARYATIGTVCFVDTEDNILVSYACLIIKPNSSLLYGEFLFYYLKSTAFLEEIKQYIKANTQANVGLDSVSKAKIALPSVHEQQKIVEYLRDKCKKIDALIAKKQQYLIEIENYKKSLIYEYVTGKKEVV